MMPAGEYALVATLISDGSEIGGFLMNYTLSEDLDGKDLHIYLPSDPAYADMNEVQKSGAMVALESVLKKCGLGPVSATQANNFNGCMVKYNEI